MTKEITKAIIIQEIEDRLKLRELEREIFKFSETVIPIYDISPHLQKWRSYWYPLTDITGTGNYEIVTVPDTEKWTLRAYNVIPISCTCTWAGVYIKRKLSRDTGDFSYLDLTAGQGTAYLRTMPTLVVLEPGDDLRINIDGYTSTASLRVYLDYMKEEIR